jgi:hypothetical protein
MGQVLFTWIEYIERSVPRKWPQCRTTTNPMLALHHVGRCSLSVSYRLTGARTWSPSFLPCNSCQNLIPNWPLLKLRKVPYLRRPHMASCFFMNMLPESNSIPTAAGASAAWHSWRNAKLVPLLRGAVAQSSGGPLVTEQFRARARAAGLQDLLAHPAAPAGDEAGGLEPGPASTRLGVKRADSEARRGVSHNAP